MYTLTAQDRWKIQDIFDTKVKSLFGNLTFASKSHEYFISGQKTPQSVSGIVKSFVPVTDWDAKAQAIARREGTTKEAILKQWADKNRAACDRGTKVHDFAENRTSTSRAEDTKEQAVLNFWNDLNSKFPNRYILLAVELKMYHLKYLFPGMCDFILYDTHTQRFIIGDYKTNEDLFKNYKEQTLLEPFDFLLDCPYNHYQIQLSLYQILFQQTDFPLSERWIIYLKEDKSYKTYKCYDFTEYIYQKLAA